MNGKQEKIKPSFFMNNNNNEVLLRSMTNVCVWMWQMCVTYM